MRSLILAGADVNALDGSNFSALHFAADVGDIESVIALIEAGAQMNQEGCQKSAIDFALSKQHVEVANYLKGVDLAQKERNELESQITKRHSEAKKMSSI